MKRMKKAFILLCIFSLIGVCVIPAGADSSVELPSDFAGMMDSLPDEVRSVLPDGLFSSDTDDVALAVDELTSVRGLLACLSELVGVRLSSCRGMLATCLGLVLFSAFFTRLCEYFGGKSHKTLNFCARLCIFSAVVSSGYLSISGIAMYFEQLTALITSALPLTCTLYSLGGNIGAAAANNSALTLALTVCGDLCGKTVVPVFCVCLCFALLGVFGEGIDLGGLSSVVKKAWLWLIGIITLILSASLAFQTTLASRGDSIGMRGAKYAAGSIIPVVGGTVAGTLGTVAASVEYLRATVGICGVILIFLMLIPSFLNVMLTRLIYSVSSGIASALGCGSESRLFSELAGLYGYIAAAECLCSIVFILEFALLAGCACAV